MVSSLIIGKFTFIFVGLILISQKNAQGSNIFGYHCLVRNTNTSTAAGTTSTYFINNLKHFSWKASVRYGFYNSSAGDEPDRVYGLYLCRGDVSAAVCHKCMENASRYISYYCPNSSEAFVWYDHCMLRYSYRNFFGKLETEPVWYHYDQCNSSEPNKPDHVKAMSLLRKLAESTRESRSMFQVGYDFDPDKIRSHHEDMYGLVQCTRDIDIDTCIRCLNKLIDYTNASMLCKGKRGCRVYYPSCNIRYEAYRFWDDPALQNRGLCQVKIIIIIITTTITSAASVILILSAGCFYCKKRKKKGKNPSDQDGLQLEMGINELIWPDDILLEESSGTTLDLPIIPLNIIREITSDFSDECKLGEGGFGPVYKGEMSDGKQVAIKRLSKVSSQGFEEFRNEVILIAKLQHRNLVRLLGCCVELNERLLLYEYMPNGSLDVLLFDTKNSVRLDWQLRLYIMNGIAKGLTYLHEDSRLRVIHRDLKASNILLDHEMNPRISDFGMAKIFGGDQRQANTNRVVGTYRYMAPEYAMEGIFSVKSDVFSFGVLLLEIIAGKRSCGFYFSKHGQNLVQYAWKLWNEGKAMELMDPTLEKSSVVSEVINCIHIGLLCVQEDASDRPTMSTVVVMLASDSGTTTTLPQPKQPAFSAPPVLSGAPTCSINEITLSSVWPR